MRWLMIDNDNWGEKQVAHEAAETKRLGGNDSIECRECDIWRANRNEEGNGELKRTDPEGFKGRGEDWDNRQMFWHEGARASAERNDNEKAERTIGLISDNRESEYPQAA